MGAVAGPRADVALALTKARILIVDDERENRDLLEIMLATEGYVLASAASGEEALALVAAAPPDLILLDIVMPGTNGYDVVAAVKADPATMNVPIILVTAHDDRETRMLGLNAGAEDFLTKPVDRAELCSRVRNLLRLKAYGDYHDRYSRELEQEVNSRVADLVESERLYRSTFDAAPVGVAHIGLDGAWLRVNQRLCKFLGYSREELLARDPRVMPEPEAAAGEAEAFRRMVAGTLDHHVIEEKRYPRRDGAIVWGRVNISVHRGADGTPLHFISVIEDITERRALEAQVRQTTKMDAVGQLASGVAHDFNNLLSVVLSYSELLALDLAAEDPMRADLNEIHVAGKRAAALTRQLLVFSRQQVLVPQVVDLTEIVGGMQKMLLRLIGEDVLLTAACAPNLARVLVDPGQMEQVILNLAVNARDAMPRGGKLVLETAAIFLDETYAAQHLGVTAGPHVMLAVTDSGTGMDAGTLAHIFEPFFTTKEPGKGTGLGLATVFGIVRQSGGTIQVTSEPGRGTTFRVYFPLADKAAARRPASSMPPPLHRGFQGKETILLVEDEESVRALAATILRRYGYEILEAQNGGDAFLLCEQHEGTIDLLLTDVVMPRMSGRQLAERLLVLRPSMKVLYMSGYTDDAVVRNGVSGSKTAFLQKPLTPDALVRKVREVLGPASTLAST